MFTFQDISKITQFFSLFAERGGFEPPVPFRGTHAFQACQLSHSCTSPVSYAGMPKNKACKLIKNCEKKSSLFTNFSSQAFIEIHFYYITRQVLP